MQNKKQLYVLRDKKEQSNIAESSGMVFIIISFVFMGVGRILECIDLFAEMLAKTPVELNYYKLLGLVAVGLGLTTIYFAGYIFGLVFSRFKKLKDEKKK